jgi:hypothetical protein
MPGASDETRRVTVLNANWAPGADGDDGRFELLVITDDDQHHVLTPSPTAVTALAALLQNGPVLAWDATNRTLIAANLVGEMPWTLAD